MNIKSEIFCKVTKTPSAEGQEVEAGQTLEGGSHITETRAFANKMASDAGTVCELFSSSVSVLPKTEQKQIFFRNL